MTRVSELRESGASCGRKVKSPMDLKIEQFRWVKLNGPWVTRNIFTVCNPSFTVARPYPPPIHLLLSFRSVASALESCKRYIKEREIKMFIQTERRVLYLIGMEAIKRASRVPLPPYIPPFLLSLDQRMLECVIDKRVGTRRCISYTYTCSVSPPRYLQVFPCLSAYAAKCFRQTHIPI